MGWAGGRKGEGRRKKKSKGCQIETHPWGPTSTACKACLASEVDTVLTAPCLYRVCSLTVPFGRQAGGHYPKGTHVSRDGSSQQAFLGCSGQMEARCIDDSPPLFHLPPCPPSPYPSTLVPFCTCLPPCTPHLPLCPELPLWAAPRVQACFPGRSTAERAPLCLLMHTPLFISSVTPERELTDYFDS